MQRKFVTNLFLILTLNLLIKPFWILGIDRYVQIAVGTEVYGYYITLFNFSFLFNILLDFGITNFNNKNIAQNNHLLSKHFASIVLLRLMLAGAFCIITLISGFFIHYTWDMMKMLLMLMFNQILISFILYLRSNLAGLHLFKTDSIISVLDRTIMIAICGFLLYGHMHDHSFRINWFIYAQTIAYLITCIVVFVIVIDKAKIRKLAWRWPFFLMILKKSYPYAILVLLMTFYNRIDFVMLERMLVNGAEQAGVYASAYRLLDATNMIAFLFAGLLLPIFSRMIKLKQSVEPMVQLAFSLLVVPAIVIATCSYFFRMEIMTMLYTGTDHIEESAHVFGVLMCCFVPIATTYIFGTLLTANGSLKQLNIMASTGMIINILLNLFLIPRMQVYGSAISSLSTQFLTAFAQVLMVQYLFRFKINYRLLGSLLLFVICAITINYFGSGLQIGWVARFFICSSLCFALAFLLRLISIRNLIHIVKYGE
ncbi:MAG: oligosaccharide flippase family protein [Bacteroidetes bacterium]|nr:oligosaccharide flippase family protein [Bacteroidota bacterium]